MFSWDFAVREDVKTVGWLVLKEQQSGPLHRGPGDVTDDTCFNNVLIYEPFVVCEFVAVLISGNNVHEKYVFGFGVESRDLHLVTGEHPSTRTKAPPQYIYVYI